VIAVENIVKRYGSFTAVDGVSLSVAPLGPRNP
jgi:ABC-type multidrug transport system ATPase subunit